MEYHEALDFFFKRRELNNFMLVVKKNKLMLLEPFNFRDKYCNFCL